MGESFPIGSGQTPHAGMTLKDYFAGQALMGLLANHWISDSRIANELNSYMTSSRGRELASQITRGAYGFADAMLRERGGNDDKP